MSKKDKYLIDYKKLYPGVDIPPEVLDVLKKSDRKMMYVELDLKSEHYLIKEGREIVLPSRSAPWNSCPKMTLCNLHLTMSLQKIRQSRGSDTLACMRHLRDWSRRSWRLSRHSIL